MITRRRLVLGTVLTLLIGWLCLCYVVVADPTLNRVQKADAIFVLGGPDVDGRATYGLDLARQGYAPTIAISVVSPWNSTVYDECTNGLPHLKVLCFDPAPRTTQGEARQLRTYAAAYGWKSVIIVTSSYHVSRARWILDRCYDGKLIMSAPPVRHSPWRMAREFVYQSVGYVKNGLITRGC